MSRMRRALRLWRHTRRLLSPHRTELTLLGTGQLFVALLCLFMGLLIQHSSSVPAALPAAMLLSLLAAAPMRTETARHLCLLTGVLTEDDKGFLRCSSRIWLWRRAAALRGICGVLLILAWLPPMLLTAAARVLWLTVPANSDAMLPLLTVLHLLLLVPASLWLPLRVYTAMTALPYVLMKAPERPAADQLRLACRLTRGQMLPVLGTRLLMLPAILLPIPGVFMHPALLSTELLRYAGRMRRLCRQGQ